MLGQGCQGGGEISKDMLCQCRECEGKAGLYWVVLCNLILHY